MCGWSLTPSITATVQLPQLLLHRCEVEYSLTWCVEVVILRWVLCGGEWSRGSGGGDGNKGDII